MFPCEAQWINRLHSLFKSFDHFQSQVKCRDKVTAPHRATESKTRIQIFKMFAVSLSIDMYETKIINRKKSFKVRENQPFSNKIRNGLHES